MQWTHTLPNSFVDSCWGMHIIPDGLKVGPADVKCSHAFWRANCYGLAGVSNLSSTLIGYRMLLLSLRYISWQLDII